MKINMKQLETDYLVIGSGAMGMAFVDTLMDEMPDAAFIIVDRLHSPGGHWNHAYPFVRLHQPSALYGVPSMPLGTDRIDKVGSNKGFYELASGAEVLAYFERVMRERFLPSGRVQYFPMHEYMGEGVFGSLLNNDQYSVQVRKNIVDATFLNTSVPYMHKRKFSVEDGVACITPNALPKEAGGFERFVILGGGKTAMDVGVWLLDNMVEAERLTWLCPRASWLINRRVTQPGAEFFESTVGGVANQFEAMAEATSPEDLFLRKEASGGVMRIDKSVTPEMFHYATISEGEIEQLALIKDVISGARVETISASGMKLSNGETVTPTGKTLYIDCTASAVDFEGRPDARPVFEDGLITLQVVYAPLVTFAVGVIARVESQFDDLAKKNMLCPPIRFSDTPAEWMQVAVQNMMHLNMWNNTPELAGWLSQCRLNPAAAGSRSETVVEPANAALLKRIQAAAIPAVMNTQNLISKLSPTD